MNYLLPIVALAAIVASGEALKCYQCTSLLNSTCSDPFDTKGAHVLHNFTTPCLCVKGVATTTNGTLTVRDCISTGLKSAFTRAGEVNITSAEAHFCSEDGCNGASTYTAGISILMSLVTLFIFSNHN